MTKNDVNVKINVDATQAEKSTKSLNSQIKDLTNSMRKLEDAGQADTEEYFQMALAAAKLRDQQGDLRTMVNTLSDDFFKQRAAMEGLSLGTNVFSQLTQAAELCGIENDNLSEALNRMQGAMNLANTAMNISKSLNKDSALMIALRVKNMKSLNAVQKTNNIATAAGTVATQGLATAEKTATAAAGQLTLGCKAVGAAIKAIPIIGWIATAVSLLMTLKDLVSGFFDEEERGVEIRKEQIKLLDEYNSRLRKVYTSVKGEADRFDYIVNRLKEVKEGGAEWEDLMQEVASATGISKDYLEEHPKIIERVLKAQHQLNESTMKYNSYQELIQDAEEELEKTKYWYAEKDEDEKEAMRIRNYMLEDQINSWKQLAKAEEMSMNATSQTMYMYRDISKGWKKAVDDKEKADEEAADKAKKKQDAIDKYEADSTKEGVKLHKQAHIAMLQEEIDRTKEGTLERVEAEDNLLEYKKKIARQELANQTGWNRLSTEERQALIRESDTKFMNEQSKLWTNYYKGLADKEYQTKVDNAKRNKTVYETELIGLEEGTYEWAETSKSLLVAQMELELLNTELTEEEKLKIKKEYAQKADEVDRKYREKQNEEAIALWRARFSAMEGIVSSFADFTSALQDAELEHVGDNERHQADIRKKYARMNFASQVASIGIDTAKGIMSVWSTAGESGPILGPILGAIQTAMIAGIGVAQTVKAKNAMNKALSGKAARGTFVTGRSHSQGGELYELEGGEAVLNKKAMAIPSFRALASAMNESTGGVSFTGSMTGASATSSPLKADIPEDTVRMIVSDTVSAVTAIPVVVTESSITSAQRNVSVLQRRATF